jgi:hypothetical protein
MGSITAQEVLNACVDEKYDNRVYSTNVHPQYPLVEVEANIVDYHLVRGNGSEETQRVKELFDRAPKDFHGVLSYGPNDEEDQKVLDKFIEEMNTEENRAEVLWIFQIVQEEVDRKLLKYLKTSPEPPSSSLPAAEASAGSDDPAAALKPTSNVPVSKKSGSKDKPLTKEEKKLKERDTTKVLHEALESCMYKEWNKEI